MNKLLMAGLVIMVALGLVWGFLTVGGPSHARLQKLDNKDLGYLQRLKENLKCKEAGVILPQTLDETGYCGRNKALSYRGDGETLVPITYKRISDRSFVICATMRTETDKAAWSGRLVRYHEVEFDGNQACLSGKLPSPNTD